MDIVDCVVVGNGPAGLTAAMYLARFRRSCVLVGMGKPRAAWIPKTHNLIGFHQGISGAALLKRMSRQVSQFKVRRLTGLASVTRGHRGFKIKVGRKVLHSKTVILATGFSDVQPKIKNLERLRKKGFVRYCPVCDAYEHIDKKIAILVRDSAGIERALFMTRFTEHLTIIAVDGFQFSPVEKRKLAAKNTAWVEGELTAISMKPRRRRELDIRLKHGAVITVEAVYVELGCNVNDSAFKQIRGIRKSKIGFLIVDSGQRLSVKGLYAAGDCVNNLGQLSVAASQGAVAATEIHNSLQ